MGMEMIKQMNRMRELGKYYCINVKGGLVII